MKLTVPAPLKDEHDELHVELAALIKLPGGVGAAAQEVAAALHPHFVKEENYALPPLSLLPAVVEGKVTTDMAAATAMTDNLKAELPTMLAEHRQIVAAAQALRAAAQRSGETAALRFADKLLVHARTEELVLYPAALLVGDMLRQRMRKPTSANA